MSEKQLTRSELETRLRRNVVKLRAGMRGISELFRRQHAATLSPELLDTFDEVLFGQLEQGIKQMIDAILKEK